MTDAKGQVILNRTPSLRFPGMLAGRFSAVTGTSSHGMPVSQAEETIIFEIPIIDYIYLKFVRQRRGKLPLDISAIWVE